MLIFLFFILLFLKIFGFIYWSWLIVFSPLWVPLLILIVIAALPELMALLFVIIMALIVFKLFFH